MVSLRSIKDSLFGEEGFVLTEIANPSITLAADAVVSETYNRSASVTTYPTEDRPDISEHAMSNSFTININGVVSDASMSFFNLIEDISSSFLGGLFGATSKSQAAWDLINNWMDIGAALDVRCKFAKNGFRSTAGKNKGSILPFVIESISIPRDSSTGSALRYSMNLRRIRQVQIGETSIISAGFAVLDRGQQQTKSNTKASTVADQPVAVSLRDDKAAAARVYGNIGIRS